MFLTIQLLDLGRTASKLQKKVNASQALCYLSNTFPQNLRPSQVQKYAYFGIACRSDYDADLVKARQLRQYHQVRRVCQIHLLRQYLYVSAQLLWFWAAVSHSAAANA